MRMSSAKTSLANGLASSFRHTCSTSLSFVLLILAASVLYGCASDDTPAAARQCPITVEAQLPIREVGRRFVTTVSINGHPMSMLIDTGTSMSTLTPHAAEMLRLPYDQKRIGIVNGIGGRLEPQHLMIASLIQLGTQNWADVRLVAANVFGPDDLDPDAPSGSIGADLLSRYNVMLDFPNQTMTLYSLCDGPFAPATGVVQTLELEQPSTNSLRALLMIPVRLNGHPVHALIDTGSSRTSATRDAAISSGVDGATLEQERAATIGGAKGVRVNGHVHVFETIQIGSATYPRGPVLVQDASTPGVDMLLGMDFLKSRKVWISYATRTVSLEGRTAPRISVSRDGLPTRKLFTLPAAPSPSATSR